MLGDVDGNFPRRAKLAVEKDIGLAIKGRAFLQQRSLYREKQAATRHAVEVAYGVMAYYGSLAESGAMSEVDAQKAAAALMLRRPSLRFG